MFIDDVVTSEMLTPLGVKCETSLHAYLVGRQHITPKGVFTIALANDYKHNTPSGV